MNDIIYFDNSATTKVIPPIRDAVVSCLEEYYGNPSSPHRLGTKANSLINEARRSLALALACSAEEIFFTSGGTEANNLCIKGAAWARRRLGQHVITTRIEHASVLETCKYLETVGFEVTYLDVDQSGIVNVEQLAKALTPETILVSIMWVNNETGAIQPIGDICRLLEQATPRPLLHVDAVQALGKLPLNELAPGIDLLTVSGHKIHGPKGVGAAKIKQDLNLIPLFHGGGQEGQLRSGTENVPGIHALGLAVKLAIEDLAVSSQRILRMRNRLVEELKDIAGCQINTPLECSVPHILNVSFLGFPGEMLLHHLEAKGLYIGTGAACSSRKAQGSHVLRAMGFSDEAIAGSCRISLGRLNTEEEIPRAVRIIKETLAELVHFV